MTNATLPTSGSDRNVWGTELNAYLRSVHRSVQGEGAVGDGVTDDTSAIQATIDAVDSATAGQGGIVYFPAGTYKITSGLTSVGGVALVGAGMRSTIIQYSGTGGDDLLKFQNGSDVMSVACVRDMKLVGTGDLDTGHGIYLYNPYHCFIERVHLIDMGSNGIKAEINSGAVTKRQEHIGIRDCWIQQCRGGGIKVGESTQNNHHTRIENCIIAGCNKYGVFAQKQASLSIVNTQFATFGWEVNGVSGDLGYPIALDGGNNCVVDNCFFESCTGHADSTAGTCCNIHTSWDGDNQQEATNTARMLVVRANEFKSADYSTCLRLNRCQGFVVEHNFFGHESPTARYGAEIGADQSAYDRGIFLANRWDFGWSDSDRIVYEDPNITMSMVVMDDIDDGSSSYWNVGVVGDDDLGRVMFWTRPRNKTYNRWQVENDGTTEWGDGNGAVDATLKRAAAGVISLSKLGVGNATSIDSTATPSFYTYKIEVFDDSGVSLGYIPVYNDIT